MPLDLARLRSRLPGRQVLWFDTVGSTMTEAVRLAVGGAPSGTVVVAEEQVAGQGRHGRSWMSERETGLYLSLILRASPPQESVPVLALALALSAQDAIAKTTGVVCDLRWPNDVIAAGRKCAGILVQLHDGVFVAGIGINVNQTCFPQELSEIATSIRLVSGRPHSREDLFCSLVLATDEFCRVLLEDGKDELLRLYAEASSYVRGRRVTVDQGEALLRGTTEGLNSSGFLILRQDDGTRSVILAGGVRPA
ncbi:MAG TPA: biotin--[acetyl-CoA-carboxylase] ligase [Bryobacteraceae bacterium]|nr:biotin--[acetyl-CoA-carboxylase] ligase [Bryobacteraceae bacterium]